MTFSSVDQAHKFYVSNLAATEGIQPAKPKKPNG